MKKSVSPIFMTIGQCLGAALLRQSFAGHSHDLLYTHIWCLFTILILNGDDIRTKSVPSLQTFKS